MQLPILLEGIILVYIALISLIVGIVCGINLSSSWTLVITNNTNIILVLLMLTVGISIGQNRGVFQKVKKYHLKVFIIPFGTIVASIIGGIVSSFILNISPKEGAAIASGMGWYSLSGVMITNLSGSTLGATAFLSNLLREILSFIAIPLIVRVLNEYAAIAPGGATSEDTTLPMLIKYTNEEVVVLAIFHGIICSAMVPVLIRFFLT